MKHAVLVGLIAFLSLGVPQLANAQEKGGDKIGYVDFQRIINDSKRGKDAKELLTKEGEFKSKKLRESEESLKKKFQELDAQRSVLSPEAFQKRQEELLVERDKFSEMVQTFQMDIRRKEQELTQDILDDVQKIISDLATKEGFSLVLEKTESGILYAPAKYNLTDRVLQLYDAQKPAAAAPKKK
jgi:outer membrane protein